MSCWRRFPSSAGVLVGHQRSCCEGVKIKRFERARSVTPVSFIEDYNLVSSGRQSDFFLSECFDFITHDVDTSM